MAGHHLSFFALAATSALAAGFALCTRRPPRDEPVAVTAASVAAGFPDRDGQSGLSAPRGVRDHEFLSLVEHLPDAVARYDVKGHGLFANRSFLDVWSMTAAQFAGRTAAEMPGGRAGELIFSRIEEVLASAQTVEFECGPETDASTGWLRWRLVPEFDRGGGVSAVIAIGRDVPALSQADQAMSEARVRRLVANIETDHELEKKGIANRLQNDLAQVLAVLGWELKRVRPVALQEVGDASMEYVIALTDRAMRTLLSIVQEIGAVTFDLGLVAALDDLVGRYRDTHGLRCRFVTREQDVCMDEERAILVYRIVDAMLGSVLETTMAAQVTLTLRKEGFNYLLELDDQNQRPVGGESIGSIVVQAFAGQLGGRAVVSEQAGLGRIIEVTFPVHEWWPGVSGNA